MTQRQKNIGTLLICLILLAKCFSQSNDITIDTSASLIINGNIIKEDQVISLSFIDSLLKKNNGQTLTKQKTKLGDGQISINYHKLGIEVIGFVYKRSPNFSFSSIIFDPSKKGLHLQLLDFLCSSNTSFEDLYSISNIRNHIDTSVQKSDVSSKEGLLNLQIKHTYCIITFSTSRKKMGKINRIQFYSPRSSIEKKRLK